MEVIETSRLLLTPLTSDFLTERYVNWLNDPDVNMYMYPRNHKESIESLKIYIENISKNNILSWAIVLKNSNKHIGNVKIDPVDRITKSGEYGIMIGDKSEWGKGYAREASIELIHYLFKKKQLSFITLGVNSKNVSAISLYTKMGFQVFDEYEELINNKSQHVLRMIFHEK